MDSWKEIYAAKKKANELTNGQGQLPLDWFNATKDLGKENPETNHFLLSFLTYHYADAGHLNFDKDPESSLSIDAQNLLKKKLPRLFLQGDEEQVGAKEDGAAPKAPTTRNAQEAPPSVETPKSKEAPGAKEAPNAKETQPKTEGAQKGENKSEK